MKTVISHATAFKFYRWIRFNNKNDAISILKLHQANIKGVPDKCCIQNLQDAQYFLKDKFDEKLPCILIRNYKNKHNINAVKIYSTSIKFPKNSFIKISENIYCPKPELLFYLLSRTLNYPELMLAGMELCGCYSLVNNEKLLNTNISPLTSSRKIKNYLNKLVQLNYKASHIHRAYKAADNLSENSYSPLESRLYIMLCSPRNKGGYAIRNMKLNQPVCLSSKAQKIAKQNRIYPDISNKNTKVAIEYDSEIYHNNVPQNEKDKLRNNALQSDGWRVFNFVKKNTYSIESLHYMALDILKANGQDKRIRQKNFITKRNALYKSLFRNFD